ncbi:MAG: hypothetical protein EXS05_00115 [Planctomycetaceae bacterium]|nr:hypothetical protein [Planctomycetaceae bacterium]
MRGELAPDQVRYRPTEAQIAIARRDLDAAVKACEAGLRLNPADRQFRSLLIRLFEAQRRPREAQQQADLLKRSAPARSP